MPTFAPGDCIGGDYEVVDFIGVGGMGDVYRVRHNILRSEYALKTLHVDKVTEKAWRRFQNEAQAIARMSHPNIVAIYNLGVHEGKIPFYVMEILVGRNLQEILADQGRLPLKKAMRIFMDVAEGIGYAHRKGIIHRDLKPPNIVLLDKADATGSRIKIVDFGIAKLTENSQSQSQADRPVISKEMQQLTRAGEVCGSPYYMSPEQCEGIAVDARSDIYSLGCTFFESLTGRPPFQGRTAVETMLMHQTSRPPTLQSAVPVPLSHNTTGGQETIFPPMLDMVISTMMAKDPDDRYQNAERLLKDLHTIAQEEFLQPQKSQARSGPPAAEEKAAAPDDPEEKDEAAKSFFNKKKTLIIVAAAAFVVLSAAGIVTLMLTSKHSDTDNSSATTSSAPVGTDPTDKSGTSILRFGNFSEPTGIESQTSSEPPLALADHLSSIVNYNGQPTAVFNFPPGKNRLGEIKEDGPGGQTFLCSGHFEVPMRRPLAYRPGVAILHHPEYLDRFDPLVFSRMSFSSTFSNEDFNDRTMAHLSRFEGLRTVEIYLCGQVSNASLPYIDALPELHSLAIQTTDINATSLSRLKRLRKLRDLRFWTDASLTPLLRALKGSTEIERLDFKRTQLSHEDYALVASMPNLVELNLDLCDVTDADLKLLLPLRKLKILLVEDNRLTARSLPVLKALLRSPGSYLRRKSRFTSAADKAALNSIYPRADDR